MMDKYIFDENNGLWYELVEDYYIACLILSPEENKSIGLWGQRHRHYLKQNRRVLYMYLLTSGKRYSYLADIDEQAGKMFSRLVMQMAEQQGITEQMKVENQMLWVGRMNNIRSNVTELINAEIIDQ